MRIPFRLACLLLAVAAVRVAPASATPRLVEPEDYYRLVDVSDPVVAPDGSVVAYVVTTNDQTADAARSVVWSVNWNGGERHPLTQGESATHPRFSPDGRFVSFLSARPPDSASQVWLLDRHGGEARQLTHTNAEVTDYAWSPDGLRVVLVVRNTEPEHSKTPRPIVIDGYRFKADETGYLDAAARRHLILVEVATGTETALTSGGDHDDRDPTWAPDGSRIAYVSNHAADAERSGIDEIYLVEARADATPRRLSASFAPNAQRIAFSPDGKSLSFLQGDAPKYNAYVADRLAVVSVESGSVRALADRLDQQVSAPSWSEDGASIDVTVEDHGAAYRARVPLAGGVTRLTPDTITVSGTSTAAGHTVILGSSDDRPPEVFALEGGTLRALTAHNESVLAELRWGTVEDTHFKSRDGTEIQGQIVKPPSYVAGRRYPTILWIHGGPNGQDQHELVIQGYSPSFERQLFAAQGYVVLGVNYRGSTGRGRKFQQSILADWGHKEVQDLLAAVDDAVAKGIADPGRLGIGGWSYGGILTDYTIASDARFKAAISGAGSGNQIGMYGVDEYVLQYNSELEPPWKNSSLYLKLSYPFFHADRIHTPTLFLGGEKDFNVPIAGGEQMYQALRTLGVPTQLVVYPGEFHVFTRPSFLKDRADRYLAWYARYLMDAR